MRYGRLREAPLSRSLLFSWIEYRFSELEARRSFVRARNPWGAELYSQAVDQQKAALRARLGELRRLLAGRGIPGLVVVSPVLGSPFERYPYRELLGPYEVISPLGAGGMGPDTLGLWGKGRFSSGVDPKYLDRVRCAIVEAAAEALTPDEARAAPPRADADAWPHRGRPAPARDRRHARRPAGGRGGRDDPRHDRPSPAASSPGAPRRCW